MPTGLYALYFHLKSKIFTVKRGLETKEECDAQTSTRLSGVLTSLISSLSDDSITYKCCTWSCCNYNSTTLALASAPTSLNISSEGLVWPGSTGVRICFTTELMLQLFIFIVILSYQAYNSTVLALASASKTALNISSQDLILPGSTGVSISCTIELILQLVISILILFY